MGTLINKSGFSIDFDSLNSKTIAELPQDIQGAANLIDVWRGRQSNFEIQTSGSTGKPKSIKLERNKIEYSAMQTATAFGLMPQDTLFCCLGLNYIAGFMMVMRAATIDCNLLVTEQIANPLSVISENISIDFAAFVPLQMETMLNDAGSVARMNRMKAILVGGAAVSDALEQRIQQLGVPVYHTYSMTETYTHVAYRQINITRLQKSYYPMPGVKISLDARGCVVIVSPLTGGKPLVTNDLAEILEDGSFIFLGRADNVINSGGIKIQLEKIESISGQVFTSLGMNPVFFASGIKDEKLGEKLILVIEGERWSGEMSDDVNEQLSIKLTKYEIPKEIRFTARIHLTKTGKLDRKRTMGNL